MGLTAGGVAADVTADSKPIENVIRQRREQVVMGFYSRRLPQKLPRKDGLERIVDTCKDRQPLIAVAEVDVADHERPCDAAYTDTADAVQPR